VHKSPCPDCARKREQRRGSRHARGYDAAWVQLRDEFLTDAANQCCAHCARHGRATPATEVDHIVPFSGPNDPLRLDRTNLQGLCGVCHRRKTAAQQLIDALKSAPGARRGRIWIQIRSDTP